LALPRGISDLLSIGFAKKVMGWICAFVVVFPLVALPYGAIAALWGSPFAIAPFTPAFINHILHCSFHFSIAPVVTFPKSCNVPIRARRRYIEISLELSAVPAHNQFMDGLVSHASVEHQYAVFAVTWGPVDHSFAGFEFSF
jgi:hypothetical protein